MLLVGCVCLFAFPQRVWQWKDEYGGKITNQIRKLGSSVDWSREAFTMDANLSRKYCKASILAAPGSKKINNHQCSQP